MSVVTNQQNSVLYTFYLPILYGYEKCVPFTLEPISEHLLMWEVCGRLLLGVNVECFYNINIKLLVISYWTYPWIIQKAFFFENKAYCNFEAYLLIIYFYFIEFSLNFMLWIILQFTLKFKVWLLQIVLYFYISN